MNYKLNIGWLYPDLMSTYGDRGNVMILLSRAKKRGINADLIEIGINSAADKILDLDIIFMGGAQDKQQEITSKDLLKNKGKYLKNAVEAGIPGLFICGAYQFLGNYYKTADGTIIPGLSIFDLYTLSSQKEKRLIGDIIIKTNNLISDNLLVGFENHGGRTYLGKNAKPFAQVVHGYGNNGKDKTEGITYKNSIGTYLHGPILSKNPKVADFLIEKALLVKYKKQIKIKDLDDWLEEKARNVIIERHINL